MYILGISAFYHDSAACLIQNENIIAAAQEERFTRIKHDPDFPSNAVKYCLDEAKISPSELSYVVFYEKPFLKFERILETIIAFAPKGIQSFLFFMPNWLKNKLFLKKNIIKQLNQILGSVNWEDKILFSEHHLSHAASAFFPSNYEEALILTMDGVGEWATSSLSIGKRNQIEILKEIHFPHSLGLLYSAFTYFLGFKVNSGEYKVMGLAPYGEPKYKDLIKSKLIDIKSDGSFRLNLSYFNYCTGLTMTNSKFHKLFDKKPRKPESEITKKDMDIAASIQKVTEEIIVKICQNISNKSTNLCLAGGVALNCVVNGIIIQKKLFKNVWIQPASGDAGAALGAALVIYYIMLENKRTFTKEDEDKMKGAYLGPSYSQEEIKRQLDILNANYKQLSKKVLNNFVAQELSRGKIIGWMNGRMEFGPRALGNRSILADPRSNDMQKKLNLKIKKRESFRPFAPSILREYNSVWFKETHENPYMLWTNYVKESKRLFVDKNSITGFEKLKLKHSEIPAVTHLDYSSRVQTVNKKTNPNFYNLLEIFFKKTGCPVLINTSFNKRGEPIICTPKDAFVCFMNTDIDILVIENFLLIKEKQPKHLSKTLEIQYELD